MPAGVAPYAVRALGQQPPEHLVGGPPDGRDGRDAEPGVDLGAARVVDAGDDVLDAEGLAGYPRRDDVGVVATGHCGEGVGLLDTGLDQRVPVEADAGDLTAPEARPEPPKRAGVLVDDRHRVTDRLDAVRDRRADPAAAHDHDMHDW